MYERIYINGRFLTQRATGVQRVAKEILQAIDAMIGRGEINCRVSLLAPRRPLRPFGLKNIPVRRAGMLSGHAWEQMELPLYSRDGFLINLCNTGPMYKHDQLVVIHDVGFRAMPDSYTYRFRAWYRILIRSLGKSARYIVTVSDFSRRELIEYFSIPSEKIHVVHNSGDHIASLEPDDTIIAREKLSARPFLLAVSSMSPRKNFSAVVRAVERLTPCDFDVVIVGGVNKRVFGEYQMRDSNRIRILGYVNTEELRALYSHATAFVYPSLYEGFGLPPLEAMTCGCPVIISDIPPHREVCGEAAIFVDPSDIEDIARKINAVMHDTDLRRRLSEAGRQRKDMFSWQKSTTALMNILKAECPKHIFC